MLLFFAIFFRFFCFPFFCDLCDFSIFLKFSVTDCFTIFFCFFYFSVILFACFNLFVLIQLGSFCSKNLNQHTHTHTRMTTEVGIYKLKMAVNPLEIEQVVELIDTKSKAKYVRYWNLFVKEQQISQDKPPNRDLILAFLKNCRTEKGYAPTTLWTVFSCLNKFCQHLYDMDLNVRFVTCFIFLGFFAFFTIFLEFFVALVFFYFFEIF